MAPHRRLRATHRGGGGGGGARSNRGQEAITIILGKRRADQRHVAVESAQVSPIACIHIGASVTSSQTVFVELRTTSKRRLPGTPRRVNHG